MEDLLFKIKSEIQGLRRSRDNDTVSYKTRQDCLMDQLNSLENIQYKLEKVIEESKKNEKE